MDKLLLEDNEVVFLSGKRPFLWIRALRSIAQNHSFYKANYYCHILKKSNVSDSLVIGANFPQKQVTHSTNSYFFMFSPFYTQEQIAPIALRSFALFLRETWAFCFHGYLQKSDCEWFTQVSHDKRATGLICSFSRANHSFAHKKTANR